MGEFLPDDPLFLVVEVNAVTRRELLQQIETVELVYIENDPFVIQVSG